MKMQGEDWWILLVAIIMATLLPWWVFVLLPFLPVLLILLLGGLLFRRYQLKTGKNGCGGNLIMSDLFEENG